MRDRVDSLGVAEPELQRSGANQIDVSLPGVSNAERAADQVGTTAQMYFYDWEPNVLDEDCKTNPESVNGGQQPISGLYNAVKRASEVPARGRREQHAPPASVLRVRQGLERAAQRRHPGREPRRRCEEDLEAQGLTDEGRDPRGARGHHRPPRGRRARPATSAARSTSWWVLKDNPVLGGTDIKNPEQNFEDGSGGPPIVTMEFSDKGREAFAQTTREIAQRGADNAALNGGLQNPISASHHFAIRLDNELISTPYINFRENPDGIDGSQGAQISGGFTLQTAQDLARLLKIGALPLRLELISRSQVSATLGQQALDQGLDRRHRGLRDRRALPARLLPRDGRHRRARARDLRDLPARADQADPDHADPAGHRRPDPHDRRRGGREHRHLRTRQRGDPPRADPISAGIAQGYKKGFATIVDANIVTLLVAFILFILATAGVKGFAFVLGVGDDGLAVHRGARDPGDPALAARHAAAAAPVGARRRRSKRKPITFDFMGASKLVLLDVRRDPAGLRARDRRQGPELRHRLRVGHADHRGAGADRPRVEQVRDAIAPAGLRRREDPDDRQPRSSARTSSRSPTRRPARPTRSRTRSTRRSASAATRRSPRSARRSASPSPTPR